MTVFQRNLEEYGVVFAYESFDEFVQNFKFQDCLLSVVVDGLCFDFLIKPGELKNAFVLFNSAVPEKDFVKTPIFTARKILSDLKSSKIYVSDPFINITDGFRCFWYLSSKKVDVQNIIKNILSHLFYLMEAERIVFWGSSGGGYPALFYSYQFENSVALVNAPTTTIKKHHEADFILSSMNSALGEFYEDEVAGVLDLKELCGSNSAFVLLNKGDRIFREKHIVPYVDHKRNIEMDESEDFVSDDLVVMIGDWGKGHLVAPTDLIKNIFKYLEYKEFDKKNLFNKDRVRSFKDLEIKCERSEGDIIVSINGVCESSKFAFYIYVNGEIKEKIGYQDSNVLRIKDYEKNANYRIGCFVRFDVDKFILRGSAAIEREAGI